MLNKDEVISAFQEFADKYRKKGKDADIVYQWLIGNPLVSNVKKGIDFCEYWIIIDDVNIANLHKFIDSHFTKTDRSGWWTFKQVTDNYIAAASYFTDHEISLMFYTCFSYRTVCYIYYKDWTYNYYFSKPEFEEYSTDTENHYLVADIEDWIYPAFPKNYFIPQHIDITKINLGNFEEPLEKTLWKARSIYSKLYDYEKSINESVEKFKKLIDGFKSGIAKKPRYFRDSWWIPLILSLLTFILTVSFSDQIENSKILKQVYNTFWSQLISYFFFSIVWIIIALYILWVIIKKIMYSFSSYKKNLKLEESKKLLKNKLLQLYDSLENFNSVNRNEENLERLNEYDKIFDEYIKDSSQIKELKDSYRNIKEKIEECWNFTKWKSLSDAYYQNLWIDYDINKALEKFSWDDEL